MMRQLVINPKKNGTVKFGKLPLFSKNLFKELGVTDFSEIVQCKVKGGYYAVELAENNCEPTTNTADNQTADTLPTATEFANALDKVTKATVDIAKTKSLEDLGFVNVSSTVTSTVNKPKKSSSKSTAHLRKPVERGNLSLFDWLKSRDYVIYKLFVLGNGEVAKNKVIDYDDVCLLFLEAGLPDLSGKSRRNSGRSAQNVTNMAIAALLRGKVLIKIPVTSGRSKYCLSVYRGENYAREVSKVVASGTYAGAKNLGYKCK